MTLVKLLNYDKPQCPPVQTSDLGSPRVADQLASWLWACSSQSESRERTHGDGVTTAGQRQYMGHPARSVCHLAVPAQRCGLGVSAGLAQWCSSSARPRPVPLWVHDPRHGVELLLAEVCTAGTTHPSGLGALVHMTGNCQRNTRGSVTCGLALDRSQRAVCWSFPSCALAGYRGRQALGKGGTTRRTKI